MCQGQFELNPIHTLNGEPFKWESSDPISDSRRARGFALQAGLVFAVDSLDQYLRNIYQLLKNVDKLSAKRLHTQVSLNERVQFAFDHFGQGQDYWRYCIEMMISWRNFAVHSNKKTLMSNQRIKILSDSSELIKANHSGIDIEQTIQCYKDKKTPTQKDIATLVSILIRSVKYFDQKFCSVEMSPEQYIAALKYQASEEAIANFLKSYSNNSEKQKNRWSNFTTEHKIPITENALLHLSRLDNNELRKLLAEVEEDEMP